MNYTQFSLVSSVEVACTTSITSPSCAFFLLLYFLQHTHSFHRKEVNPETVRLSLSESIFFVTQAGYSSFYSPALGLPLRSAPNLLPPLRHTHRLPRPPRRRTLNQPIRRPLAREHRSTQVSRRPCHTRVQCRRKSEGGDRTGRFRAVRADY